MEPGERHLWMPSHTDGDLSVYFQKANVLATGDTWWNGIYPFIDYVAGGSIDGMIKAANWNIEKSGPETIVVPGHGPAGSRQELIAFRDMLVTIRTRVAALKAEGKSLEETVAARPTAEFDAKWGGGVINPALFTQLIYRGVGTPPTGAADLSGRCPIFWLGCVRDQATSGAEIAPRAFAAARGST